MPKATPVYYATGRRKCATARVYMRPGNGQFLVNKRTLDEFFPRETLKMTPRKGKAILWANVQEDWRSFEPAAMHRAFPVRSGIKWASTLWIHAAGFRIPELYAGPACQPPR